MTTEYQSKCAYRVATQPQPHLLTFKQSQTIELLSWDSVATARAVAVSFSRSDLSHCWASGRGWDTEDGGKGPLGPAAWAMSKVVSLSYKKSQKLLQSLRDQQRHSLGTGFESANILLSPKYRLKDKDLRKIHKAARVGDAARVQQLLLRKCCVNDRDKKKRYQGPRGEGLWRRRGLCTRKPPNMT